MEKAAGEGKPASRQCSLTLANLGLRWERLVPVMLGGPALVQDGLMPLERRDHRGLFPPGVLLGRPAVGVGGRKVGA